MSAEHVFTREEILQIAKENAPDDIEIDVKENDDGFLLKLKDSIYEASYMIPSHKYSNLSKEDKQFIGDKLKQSVVNKITDFGISEANYIIEKFGLDEHYREKYVDKNILYKVKREYTIQKAEHRTHTMNFGLYYIERVKDLTKYPSMLRLFVVDKTKHARSEEISEILFSIILRFEQLLFAFDRIEEITKESGRDNDVLFIVGFHLYYFISLVKTLGDNLTWLLKLCYDLNLNYTNLDLLSEAFKTSLKHKNRNIHDIIFNHPIFPHFKKIKDFRDIIQHRQTLHVVPVMLGIKGPERIMIPKDPESLVPYGLRINKEFEPILARAEDPESMVEYGSLASVLYAGPPEEIPYEEPAFFCKKYIEFLSNIFTNIFAQVAIELNRKPIGKITNYLKRKGVAVVELSDRIAKGDKVLIEGNTTSFQQVVESLQIDREPVESAERELVGLKVDAPVRRNDTIYKI